MSMCCCKFTDDKKSYCLSCYATNSAVPLSSCDGSKIISDMRQEMKKELNFDHVDTLHLDEIDEAYNKMEFVLIHKGQ